MAAIIEEIRQIVPEGGGRSEPRLRRWTRAEYHRLADLGLLRPGERTELIDGDILVMPPQKTAHFTSVTLVFEALHPIFSRTHVVRQQGPLSAGEATEPEPDIAVAPGTARDYETAHPASAALVVEVSETTLRYDQTTKASLYARMDVPDYWVVDLVHRRVEVRREPVAMPGEAFGCGYRTVTLHLPGERISPLLAPDTSIGIDDLLPRAFEDAEP